MPPTTYSHLNPSPIFMAGLAAVAAHLGGSSFTSRTHPRFVGGYLASSRCIGGMAAANTVFPAAKSAKPPSSRRQTT